MALNISLQVDRVQAKRLNDRLAAMARNCRNWKPFWPSAQAIWHRSIVANFRQGGRPEKWKPLTSWTIAARGGAGLSDSPLMDTGALVRSIGTINVQRAMSFNYGSNLKYAKLMNYGTAGLPGGLLKPRSGKYLALPFPGVKGRPRKYRNTFVVTTKNSKIIWQKMRGAPARPLFLLKKSVRIPARPYMVMQKEDVDRILALAMVYVKDPAGFRGGV